MEPNRVGKIFGIGARVAVEKLREGAERVGSSARPAAPGAEGAAKPMTAQEAGARVGAGVRQAAANFRAAQASAGNAQAGAESDAGLGRARSSASAGVPEGARDVARGAGRFGAALVRPFAHATSLLWAQITGIFFALFAVFFMEHTWMVYRAAHWRDRLVFLYAALAVVFLWFAVSAFWRVRRKQRRG